MCKVKYLISPIETYRQRVIQQANPFSILASISLAGSAPIIGWSFWILITGCDFRGMLRARESTKISNQ
jgi:hypothetical protein